METIDQLLDFAIQSKNCVASPPCGLPKVAEGLTLPADIVRFYERVGGLVINKDARYGGWSRIMSPSEFDRIDWVICREVSASGPFRFWYAIADVGEGNYMAVDIGPTQPGMCLDSFHETFDQPGYVEIIATSFTDLLRRLITHPEDSSFWLQDGFQGFGDAFSKYDQIAN